MAMAAAPAGFQRSLATRSAGNRSGSSRRRWVTYLRARRGEELTVLGGQRRRFWMEEENQRRCEQMVIDSVLGLGEDW
jgi:hypothetical protein